VDHRPDPGSRVSEVFRSVYPAVTHIELRANPKYWGGAPKVGAIIFQEMPEASVRLLSLEQGKVQLLADVPPQDVARLRHSGNVRVLTQPGLAVDGMGGTTC